MANIQPTTLKDTSKNISDPSDPAVAGEALAQAIKYLQNRWGWKGPELSSVLHIPVTTINTWLSSGKVPVKKPLSLEVQVILTLITIHKSLSVMFEKPEHQLSWLNTIHPDMDDTPLSKMKNSMEGLIGVRSYLDYVRGRGA